MQPHGAQPLKDTALPQLPAAQHPQAHCLKEQQLTGAVLSRTIAVFLPHIKTTTQKCHRTSSPLSPPLPRGVSLYLVGLLAGGRRWDEAEQHPRPPVPFPALGATRTPSSLQLSTSSSAVVDCSIHGVTCQEAIYWKQVTRKET